MLKIMLLLGLVLAVVVAHPQGTHRVRRYYYNEDRDLQNNEHSRGANNAIKGGEASTATQSSGIYPQVNNGNRAYGQGYSQENSGNGPYPGPYGQKPDSRSTYHQVSDHSFDQGRNLHRQGQIFQRQNSRSGGYQEFGY